MQKVVVLLVVVGFFNLAYSQEKKHYFVEQNPHAERVVFSFSASSGSCEIKPTSHKSLVNIYERSRNQGDDATFNSFLNNGVQIVNYEFFEQESEGIGRKISSGMFSGSSAQKDHKCNIYLSQETPFQLNLNYGIGDADIDLSGLAVEQLKIKTGSADVNLSCLSGQINRTKMDTFYVKVDMGELNIDQMNLSNAENIIADIGFGNLTMNFGEKSHTSSNIQANVGAGSMKIQIAKDDMPVIIHVNNSPLCRVKLTKNFEEIEDNVFVNKAYSQNAENVLTFNVGVALGNITFIER
jgi:hypothetical protein